MLHHDPPRAYTPVTNLSQCAFIDKGCVKEHKTGLRALKLVSITLHQGTEAVEQSCKAWQRFDKSPPR